MMIEKCDFRDNLITVRYFYNDAIITLASIDSDAKLLATYSDINEAVANEMKMLKDRNDGKKYYLDVTNNAGHKVIVSHSEIIK
ncbi:hypothetical protein CJD36_000875 [Flavipsychrobacter stenotrophus]|uniref:Uncharacterized protein n=1 Tax=Flavipsychrobacter stenotrophus TaxID=2077091 RepID=A0A2S7SZG0_9BACT|nr:hypothetical protein [Flavipsychrobacter stenotrophus]PQJ12340.1 hypothetical protein CJD36_000875 [Flavipsychrobacter stenotrophus]